MLLLVLLFGTAVVLWFTGYTLGVLIVALAGLIITASGWSRGKKMIGNTINLGETGLSIRTQGASRDIAFAEIRQVKINQLPGVGPHSFSLTTLENESIKIVPQHYEDGRELLADLQETFSRRQLL